MCVILGIESSCDETAAAIVDIKNSKIISNQIYSQTKEHIEYGGVVPEIASRAHLERIEELVDNALTEANMSLSDIDGIAATRGPGLLGGLLVGFTYAKSLSMATGKPLVGVNHLEGHALTAHLTENLDYPYLLLLVSGGHCQFIHVEEQGQYNTLGGTLDDAVGECFDKVAKMMGLPYPGGPNIEKSALNGDPHAYKFTIPLRKEKIDFSFSGLKTALRTKIHELGELDEKKTADLCASFQETVAQTLELKSGNALDASGVDKFVLAGGVAANKLLRSRLEQLCVNKNVSFYAPPINLCTDNAVMIAYAGGLRIQKGENTPLDTGATPRWPLNNLS